MDYKPKALYTLIIIIITMKKMLVVISDEAHTILKEYRDREGFGNLDDALDSFLKEKVRKGKTN